MTYHFPPQRKLAGFAGNPIYDSLGNRQTPIASARSNRGGLSAGRTMELYLCHLSGKTKANRT